MIHPSPAWTACSDFQRNAGLRPAPARVIEHNRIDYAGIEVGAEELIVALRREGKWKPLKSFPNDPQGHKAIVPYLAHPGHQVRVCLESTGVYGLDLALALHAAAGIEVMVANSRAVRHFAEALMQRSKNDRLDALVILEFAARMPFQAWQPPSPAARHLCALARRLEALTELCAAEKNRLHAAGATQDLPPIIREDLERSLRFHARAMQRLKKEALRVVAQDPELQRKFQLLRSVKGIAEASALHILAAVAVLLPDLDPAGRDQWVAYAGLDPRECSSGGSVHKKTRISKAGNRHLRRALYTPALAAVRREPHFRAYYEHLLARGKTKMQALVAVMRKLLHAIYGMFPLQSRFDGSKVYQLPAGTPTTGAPRTKEVAYAA
jgi:transposase